MKAIAIDHFGGPDVLHVAELPDPKLPPDAIRIRTRSAGVNPVDAAIRRGLLDGLFPHAFPLVPGWDVAGVVEAAGPAVTGFVPGDEVMAYARKEWIQEGCYAELVTVRASAAARKPDALSFDEAGGVPLAGLTAYQCIYDVLRLQAGETVLVYGASGGVGSFATQLCRIVGCHAIGVASAPNHDFLRELGAAECVDYRAGDVAEQVRAAHPDGIDAVIDVIGPEGQGVARRVLAPGGRLVSVVVPPDVGRFSEAGLEARYHFVSPDGDELRVLGALAEGGELRVPLEEVLPLEEARLAHERIESGHTRGKLVLRVE